MKKLISNLQFTIYKKNERGFTLIELLVVVSLVGILATLVLANLNAARERGRDAQRKSDIKSIQNALQLYYNDYGIFPDDNSGGQILGCGVAGTSACTWGEEWAAGGTKIMGVLPSDPIPGIDYVYQRSSLDGYILTACLENVSDDDGIADGGGIDCDSNWMYQVEQ